MMWLLTDKEIADAWPAEPTETIDGECPLTEKELELCATQVALAAKAVVRAQLQKVAFSLYGPCTEHHDDGTYMIDCERCLDGLIEEARL